jgi:hypothetical protein
MTFDEIADFLDRQNELTKSNNDGSIDPLKWVKFLKTCNATGFIVTYIGLPNWIMFLYIEVAALTAPHVIILAAKSLYSSILWYNRTSNLSTYFSIRVLFCVNVDI